MKILGIICSPRKNGNTEIMMNEVLAAAREAGAETEIISIVGKKIAPCDACYACFEKPTCHIKDDMQPIYDQMLAADAIVFGTPVYFGDVTAQAKTVIDRTFAFYKEKKLKGKVGASLIALRRIGASETRNVLYNYFVTQGMLPIKAAVGYGLNKGEVKEGVGSTRGLTALEEARNLGKEIVELLGRLKN